MSTGSKMAGYQNLKAKKRKESFTVIDIDTIILEHLYSSEKKIDIKWVQNLFGNLETKKRDHEIFVF